MTWSTIRTSSSSLLTLRRRRHHRWILCYAAAAAAAVTQRTGVAMAFSTSSGNGGQKGEESCSGVLLQGLQGQFDASSSSSSSSSSFLPSHPHMAIHHLTEPVASTQDEARKLLTESKGEQFFAVIADQQQAGRGTNGRNWESSTGNLYLTVALPMAQIPVLLTLLPLQIAVLVADRAETILKHHCGSENVPRVRVKWPNDVLVDQAKLSGTLIESASSANNETWFLIGIGVNVQHAPSLAASPGKQVRPAVSLQECCNAQHAASLPMRTALYLGTDLAYALADWVLDNQHGVSREAANQAVLNAWKAKADFGTSYEIRSNNVGDEETPGYQGEQVVAVDIAPDGQLKVRGANGQERLLVADYFF